MKKFRTLFVASLFALSISGIAYADDDTADNVSCISVDSIEEDCEEIDTCTELGDDIGEFKLTAYCSCKACNGKWTGQPTSLGTGYEYGRTIAVDKRIIPLGTWVYIDIPGEGWQKFRAEDTGSAIKGNRIDIYVNNHSEVYQERYNKVCNVKLSI